MEQVKALDDKNGGGNRLATEKWMGSMPDSERPGSSDTATLEALKRFVDRVYNEKRWENKDGGTPSKSPTPSGHSGSTKGTSVNGRDTSFCLPFLFCLPMACLSLTKTRIPSSIRSSRS